MLQINLAAIPNQSFTFTGPGGALWALALVDLGNNQMAADIEINGRSIVKGHRLVAGAPLVPYAYLSGFGNMIFDTPNDEVPYWTEFGGSHTLWYATLAELQA